MIKQLAAGALMVGAVSGAARGDPSDLAWGVFITHHVPELAFTTAPPPEGWCGAYWSHPLEVCADQNARVDVNGRRGCVWFVLAAWEENKVWCEAEFGFGEYDPRVFSFLDRGPCFPGTGLEVPTSGWPGPNEGIALAAQGTPWAGNFMPVYRFGGYAYSYYGAEIIPLGPNPATGSAGTTNCVQPAHSWATIELGGLGINTDGIVVCPEGLRSACCDPVTYECHMLSQGDCGTIGGHWAPVPFQCPHACDLRVCCHYGSCLILSAPECFNIGGIGYGMWVSCDPNPCGGPSPLEDASWGRIKALYREE